MSEVLPLTIATLRGRQRVLSRRRELRLEGEDVRSWLNGQVTNNVLEADSGSAVYALIVNLKGKILADVWVLIEDEETIKLLVPETTRSMLMEYLDGFIIMEDVELFDDSEAIYGLSFEDDAKPEGRSWELTYLGLPARLSECDPAANTIGDFAWTTAHYDGNRPLFGIDFNDKMLPQEAGLKDLAVSFNKGCYQGQEAIVMLEHRGKPPKRLVNLSLSEESNEDMSAGTPILDQANKEVGAVTLALHTEDVSRVRGWIRRATLEREDAELSINGSPVNITSLIG